MRATILALALAATGCTLSPSLSGYEPKAAADCPGQKACGHRCVDVDDPEAGCGLATCAPCPAGPANTVPACGEGQACAMACLPGFAAGDGDPAHGCGLDVRADASNCGALGHACAAGDACAAGLCPVRSLPIATGVAPRGLALGDGGAAVGWAVDPPVAAGIQPVGALKVARLDGTALPGAAGFGHATWVRGGGATQFAVAGTDPTDDTVGLTWIFDPAAPYLDGNGDPTTIEVRGGGQFDNRVVGLALWPAWVVTAMSPGYRLLQYQNYEGYSGGGLQLDDGNGGLEEFHGLGEGAGFLWLGGAGGVYRLTDAGGIDTVPGGGVYFEPLAVPPRPHRIGATAGAGPADPIQVWFADLSDGSIWTGLTKGRPGDGPWRLVRGDGPRTQMDLAADGQGAVWSDLDRGELWAVRLGGRPYRLASGVRPWAVALAVDRVYFTDVDAQAIRWVAR